VKVALAGGSHTCDLSATMCDHSATMCDNSATMRNHSSTMRDHSATICDHSATKCDHRATMCDHNATMCDHSATMQAWLDKGTCNSWDELLRVLQINSDDRRSHTTDSVVLFDTHGMMLLSRVTFFLLSSSLTLASETAARSPSPMRKLQQGYILNSAARSLPTASCVPKHTCMLFCHQTKPHQPQVSKALHTVVEGGQHPPREGNMTHWRNTHGSNTL
jgi:hypothetical protein